MDAWKREKGGGGTKRREGSLCVCADKAEGPRVLEEWVNGMEMLMSILCVCVWYYVYIYVCIFRYCCSTCRCHAADHDEIISKVREIKQQQQFDTKCCVRDSRQCNCENANAIAQS